jgi:hypothetical protein
MISLTVWPFTRQDNEVRYLALCEVNTGGPVSHVLRQKYAHSLRYIDIYAKIASQKFARDTRNQ